MWVKNLEVPKSVLRLKMQQFIHNYALVEMAGNFKKG